MKNLTSLSVLAFAGVSACGNPVVNDAKFFSAVNLGRESSKQPVCSNIGTKGEGWYVDGFPLIWSACENKTLACLNMGTPQEGWYEVEASNWETLKFDFCSQQQAIPRCTAIGTRSEGFSSLDTQGNPWRKWEFCEERVAVCKGVGTRMEGWFSARVESSRPLLITKCSGENALDGADLSRLGVQ